MTQEELQAIRERCDKATSLPWSRLTLIDIKVADLKFVINARTDLPKALDEIERQAKEIERLKVSLKAYESECMCRVTDTRCERCKQANQALEGMES